MVASCCWNALSLESIGLALEQETSSTGPLGFYCCLLQQQEQKREECYWSDSVLSLYLHMRSDTMTSSQELGDFQSKTIPWHYFHLWKWHHGIMWCLVLLTMALTWCLSEIYFAVCQTLGQSIYFYMSFNGWVSTSFPFFCQLLAYCFSKFFYTSDWYAPVLFLCCQFFHCCFYDFMLLFWICEIPWQLANKFSNWIYKVNVATIKRSPRVWFSCCSAHYVQLRNLPIGDSLTFRF